DGIERQARLPLAVPRERGHPSAVACLLIGDALPPGGRFETVEPPDFCRAGEQFCAEIWMRASEGRRQLRGLGLDRRVRGFASGLQSLAIDLKNRRRLCQ